MRRLNHPHIVEYYETIRTEGYLNIVLEYVTLIYIFYFMNLSMIYIYCAYCNIYQHL